MLPDIRITNIDYCQGLGLGVHDRVRAEGNMSKVACRGQMLEGLDL